MTTYEYQAFAAYYGGTSAETLRQYAAQSLLEQDTSRAEMFTRLAEEIERGVKFVIDDSNSKLSYRRL